MLHRYFAFIIVKVIITHYLVLIVLGDILLLNNQ